MASTTANAKLPRVCFICKNADVKALKCCTGCFQRHYCSEEHQMQDWEGGHKFGCKQRNDWCNFCGTKEKLNFCTGCYRRQYCSVEHQKQDWPSHKLLCRTYHLAAPSREWLRERTQQSAYELMADFAELEGAIEKLEENLAVTVDTLAAITRNFGDDYETAMMAYLGISKILGAEGRSEECLNLIALKIGAFKERFAFVYYPALLLAGNCYVDTGRYYEAEPFFEIGVSDAPRLGEAQAHDSYKYALSLFHIDDFPAAGCFASLAIHVFRQKGNLVHALKRAEDLLRDSQAESAKPPASHVERMRVAVANVERKSGKQSLEYVRASRILARHLLDSFESNAAEAVLWEIVSICRQLPAEDALEDLGCSLLEWERAALWGGVAIREQRMAALQEAKNIFQCLDEMHPRKYRCLMEVHHFEASDREAKELFPQAAASFRRCLEIAVEIFGERTPRKQGYLFDVARCLVKTEGDWFDEVEELVRRVNACVANIKRPMHANQRAMYDEIVSALNKKRAERQEAGVGDED